MPGLKSPFKSETILNVLKKCLKDYSFPVALHPPTFAGNEWKYVKECLDTRWVSSVGKYVDEFENRLSDYTGVKNAVAVVNGTAALHIALKLGGVQAGDEVLIPTLTFVATANAVSYLNAMPHFLDCETNSLGIDPDKLEAYLEENTEVRQGVLHNRQTGSPIKALIAVHLFGHPVDLDRILQITQKYHLVLIEDAAESLGSFYKNRHTGNWGKISILSFNGNKILTTGGGGAILTHDKDLAHKAKHLTTTARIPHDYFFTHDEVGYNYRLPNINAALGCAQLEELPHFLKEKRELANQYSAAFSNLPGIQFFTEPAYAKSNYWLNALLLDHDNADQRDELLKLTNQAGIQTRPCWTLMHRLPMYKTCPKMDLSTVEDVEARLINIPSGVRA